MAGNSKGGQTVLMEAQRFPVDYDGLLPSAAVYDYTGRNTIAAACDPGETIEELLGPPFRSPSTLSASSSQ